jgi:hypothetical protein
VDEINEVLQSALDYKVSLQEPWIDVGKFGIIDCGCDKAEDSALLVEWTTLPYTLQKDALINSMGDNPVEAGTTVVEGIVYPHWNGNPYWFQRGKLDGNHKPRPEIFLLQHVAMGKVGVTHGEIGTNMPTKNKSGITPWAKMQPRDLIQIFPTVFKQIQREIKDRTQLDLIGWENEEIQLLAKQLEQVPVDDSDESDDDDEKENNEAWIPKKQRDKFITPLKGRPRRDK